MLRQIVGLTLVAGLVGSLELATTSPARADVVYEQTAAFPSTGIFNGAWTSYEAASVSSFQVFDNFRLSGAAALNQVGWQGVYYDYVNPANNPPTPNTDSFQITFLADSHGLPGTPLLTETVSGASLQTTAAGNGTLNGVTVPVFNYVATLPSTFAATADQTYWISIVSNSSTGNPLWAWTGGTSGLDQATIQEDSTGTFFLRPNDRALTLTAVPEPPALIALAIGLSGMLLARRRSR